MSILCGNLETIFVQCLLKSEHDTRHSFPIQGSILPPLLACYATVPLVHLNLAGSGMMTVAGILAFQWKSRAWRRQVTERRHFCKRVLILTLCGESVSLRQSHVSSSLASTGWGWWSGSWVGLT